MNKTSENQQTVVTPVQRPGVVRAWNPQTIPGRRPLLSGKIKFTITRAVPSKHETDKP